MATNMFQPGLIGTALGTIAGFVVVRSSGCSVIDGLLVIAASDILMLILIALLGVLDMMEDSFDKIAKIKKILNVDLSRN